jgi:hypothetical protein
MRQTRKLLHGTILLFLGLAGCRHQPELKPPEQPEVLAMPSDKDKRYAQPCSYPSEVLASDPSKKADGLMPAAAKNGPSAGISPAGGGRMGAGPGGY